MPFIASTLLFISTLTHLFSGKAAEFNVQIADNWNMSTFYRTHDIPYADETPGSTGDHPPQPQSDTDYETCDSGMSSDRSSMESGTIGGTHDDDHGTRLVGQALNSYDPAFQQRTYEYSYKLQTSECVELQKTH